MNHLITLCIVAIIIIAAELYLKRARKGFSTENDKAFLDMKASEGNLQIITILAMALLVFILLLFKVEYTKINGLIFYIIFLVSYISGYAWLVPKTWNKNIPDVFLRKYLVIKFFRVVAATLLVVFLSLKDVIK